MAGSTAWWSTFFDDAYVELWSKDAAFDNTEQEVRDLLDLLALEAPSRILDVPCGFGRIARPLHDLGHDVVGVDLSADQLRLAGERNPGPSYALGDMREPPDGPFDAVLNLYSSFGYFEDPADDVACIEAWHRVLRPGGVLVIETMHRDRIALLSAEPADPGARGEQGTTDWVTGVRTSTIEVGDETREFRVRLYTATEIVKLLGEAGFTEIEVHGGLGRLPFDPTQRLAVRAVRG